jgi:hypothetical protein
LTTRGAPSTTCVTFAINPGAIKPDQKVFITTSGDGEVRLDRHGILKEAQPIRCARAAPTP